MTGVGEGATGVTTGLAGGCDEVGSGLFLGLPTERLIGAVPSPTEG